MTERELQTDCVADLRKKGFKVYVTSQRGKSANTRGLPDVLIYLGRGYWLGLEFKTLTGKTTPEQDELEKIGAIKVVRTKADCMNYVAKKLKEHQ